MLNKDEVLKLIDAGFTAEQILKMDASEEPEKQPEIKEAKQEKLEPEKKPEPENKPEPEKKQDPAVDPDVKKVIDQALKSMEEAMDKNLKSMAEAFRLQLQPSIGDVKPLGIEDVITNFFK